MSGIEPETSHMRSERSTTELHPHMIAQENMSQLIEYERFVESIVHASKFTRRCHTAVQVDTSKFPCFA